MNCKIKQLILMASAMLAMLVPQEAWAAGTKPTSGDGSTGNPYQIASEANLIWFRDAVNGVNTGTGTGVSICGKLTADITLTGTWTPIGNSSKIYTGTFDGQGHKISGLNHTATAANAGLFSYVNNATIQNFTLAGSVFSNSDNVGSVVGYAKGSTTIQNIVSTVNITMTAAKSHLGGIAGNIENSTSVLGCTYSGTLNAGSSTDSNGGIVGFANANCSGTVKYCFFNGTIKTTGSGPQMGGILGYTNDTDNNFGGVQNCYSCGTLAFAGSDQYANALVGRIRSKSHTTINNTFLSGTATRACNENCDEKVDFTKNYAITINVTAGTGGTVSQSYVNPTSTTATKLHVEATPKTGYHFTKWSDNNTTANRNDVALTDNVSLTATFGAHTYGDWITDKAATCTASGTKHRVCTHTGCDAREDGTIPALGHGTTGYTPTYTWGGTYSAATCTFTLKCNKCSSNVVCNQSLTTSKVSASHKDATCTAAGNERWKATGNYSKTGDATYSGTAQNKDYAIPALGHDFTSQTATDTYLKTAATCTTDAVYYHKCSRCTTKGTTTWTKTGTATGHGHTKGYTPTYTWSDDIDAHTCNFTLKCLDCNTNVVSNSSLTVTQTAHTDPTCTANGSTTYRVTGSYNASGSKSYSGDNSKTYTIAALGHDFTSQTATVTYLKSAATCTEDAVYFYKCSRCAEKAETCWSETGTMLGVHILNDQSQCTRSGCNHQAKAVYNEGTLTFYFDAIDHVGVTYSLNTIYQYPGWYNDGKYKDITSVVFDESFAAARPTSCYWWFGECRNLTSISGFKNLNTEEVEYMNTMFYCCPKLKSLDLSNFNTAKVKNMETMFQYCDNLTSLDLSSFNTGEVTSMSYFLANCSKLEELTIGNLNMRKVVKMSRMFYSCPALDTLTMKSVPYLAEGTFDDQFSGAGKVVNLILDENSVIYEGNDNHLPVITNCNHYNQTTIVHVDATCTKGGYDDYICSYCNSLFDKKNIVSALGHHLDANGICSVCNYGMVGETIPCTATAGSAGYEGETYDKAFDGTTSTKWCHNTTNPWVEFQTAWSVIVTGYKLSTANDTQSDPSRNPKNWVLKGWSEEKQAWSVLETKSNDNTLQAMNETEYNFELAEPGKVAYQHFRMEFTHSGLMQLSEISITGFDESIWCEHEMTYHPAVAETCTTGNKEYWTCSKPCCADKYFKDEAGTEKWASYPTIAACHDFTQEKAENEFLCSAATCTQQARYYFSCSRCDENEHDDNHTFAYGELAEHQLDDDGACTLCTFGHLMAKAVLADNILTFYFDKLEHDGETYSLNTGDNYPDWYWNNCESITSVVFDASFAAARPTSCHCWFYCFWNLTSISGLEYLNTEEVTNMEYMFYHCYGLQSLDLSSFNTANVTDMNSMFLNCSGLQSLDLSSFNTANVTNMFDMFRECFDLKSLVIGNFDMRNVQNRYDMLCRCDNLNELTLKSLPFLADGTFNTQFSGAGKTVNLVLDDNSVIYAGENYLPEATSVNYTRNLAAGKTVTFMLPFDVPVENINGKVYELSDFDGQTLSFSAVEDTVQANTPYLLTEPEEGNLLKKAIGSWAFDIEESTYTQTVGEVSMEGTYTKQAGLFSTDEYSIYGYSGGQFVRQKSQEEATEGAKGATLNPFRALIKVTGSAGSAPARLALAFDEETTGVISLSDDEQNTCPVNVYSLDGKIVRSQVDPTSCLQDLPKGIYVVNGKRVVK